MIDNNIVGDFVDESVSITPDTVRISIDEALRDSGVKYTIEDVGNVQMNIENWLREEARAAFKTEVNAKIHELSEKNE